MISFLHLTVNLEDWQGFIFFPRSGHTTAHHCCAAWSDGVCQNENFQLLNVDKAVFAGTNQVSVLDHEGDNLWFESVSQMHIVTSKFFFTDFSQNFCWNWWCLTTRFHPKTKDFVLISWSCLLVSKFCALILEKEIVLHNRWRIFYIAYGCSQWVSNVSSLICIATTASKFALKVVPVGCLKMHWCWGKLGAHPDEHTWCRLVEANRIHPI